jgi:hypothetical protein
MNNGVAISDYDLAQLRSLYPLCNFNAGFSAQEERFILFVLRGIEPNEAATAAGYSTVGEGGRLMRAPRIKAGLDMLRKREFYDIRITRESLSHMLLEAHAKAATATEEIAAIRELGKMNGLYAPEQRVNTNVNTEVKTLRHLQQLNDNELLKLAGEDITLDFADFKEVASDHGV